MNKNQSLKVYLAIGNTSLENYLKSESAKISNAMGYDTQFVGATSYREAVVNGVKDTRANVLIIREGLTGATSILKLLETLRVQIPSLRIIVLARERDEPYPQFYIDLVQLGIYNIIISNQIHVQTILEHVATPGTLKSVIRLLPPKNQSEAQAQTDIRTPKSIQEPVIPKPETLKTQAQTNPKEKQSEPDEKHPQVKGSTEKRGWMSGRSQKKESQVETNKASDSALKDEELKDSPSTNPKTNIEEENKLVVVEEPETAHASKQEPDLTEVAQIEIESDDEPLEIEDAEFEIEDENIEIEDEAEIELIQIEDEETELEDEESELQDEEVEFEAMDIEIDDEEIEIASPATPRQQVELRVQDTSMVSELEIEEAKPQTKKASRVSIMPFPSRSVPESTKNEALSTPSKPIVEPQPIAPPKPKPVIEVQPTANQTQQEIKHETSSQEGLFSRFLGGKKKDNAPRLPTQVITYIGARGGVGNSQTAFSTAVKLAEKGKQVLYIDLHEWQSSIDSIFQFGYADVGIDTTLEALLNEDYGKIERSLANVGKILPVTPREHSLYKTYSKFPKTFDFMCFSQDYMDSPEPVADESIFKELLLYLLMNNGYDAIFIDAQPNLHSKLSQLALIYSSKIVFTLSQDYATLSSHFTQVKILDKKKIQFRDKCSYVITKHRQSLLDVKTITELLSETLRMTGYSVLTVPDIPKESIDANYLGVPVLWHAKSNKELQRAFISIVAAVVAE